MSSKRVFQHANNNVNFLKGVLIKGIKYVYNNLSEKENILFVWLNTEKDTWLRIIIDGTYCQIDEYLYDESACNLEENMTIVDYSKWIVNTEIFMAKIECVNLPEIVLTIDFSNNKRIVFACNQDENCSIRFLTQNK